VPDPKQDLAVGGPLLERIKRGLLLLAVRLIRLPIRILTFPISQLREEVTSLRAAAVESIAYVGVELRRLGDLIERGQSTSEPAIAAGPGAGGRTADVVEFPFAFRSLAGVESPGPVLVVGAGGRGIDRSLASLGYEVSTVSRLEDVAEGEAGFQAVLFLSAHPDPDALERIDSLLGEDGMLVMSVPFGVTGANGTDAAFDQSALDGLLGDWAVAEEIVVASGPGERWAPVQNGGTPEHGVALVAARRSANKG
jgi:hypothetical protein